MSLSGLGYALSGILFGLISALPVFAASDETTNDKIRALRADFLAAERALTQGQIKRYRELKDTLAQYPLLPYLEYREIKRKLDTADPEQVETFLTDYAATPLAPLLRGTWLDRLAKSERWTDFLRYFQGPGSVSEQCNRLRALMKTGAADEAIPEVEPLWLNGRSRPKECDPVFDSWIEQGHLSASLVWQRIELAMDESQIQLAKYLGRFLPADDQTVLDQWLQVHRDPGRLTEIAGLSGTHPRRGNLLLHGIKRLARRDEELALSVWDKIRDKHDFTLVQEAAAERALAVAFVRKGNPAFLSLLSRYSPNPDDLELHEARISQALEQTDWGLTLDWIESLPLPEQNTERWIYWRARALDELGDREESSKLLRNLVVTRSYYGFLAADALGTEYSFNHDPVSLGDNIETEVSQHPRIVRAKELRELGRLADARREWREILQIFTREQLLAAAKLARSWGWHEQAIFSLAHLEYWDDLELRFPLEYQRPLEKQANGNGLDTAWIFAVVRQESAFMQDARSPAGALGLMQLMPRTAETMAKKLNLRRPRQSDLLKPTTNIRLGTAYLRRIYKQLDENPVLATAAYNAGPHRVRSWLPEKTVPADVWIETVPFRETRDYLMRVLAYTVIYENRLGLPAKPLLHRMPPIHPQTPLTTDVGKASQPSG